MDVVALLYKLELGVELNMHWKYCGLYTLATIGAIALREPIDKYLLIELQLHEKLSLG